MPRQAATLHSQSLGWVRLSSLMANDEYAWRLMQGNTAIYCIMGPSTPDKCRIVPLITHLGCCQNDTPDTASHTGKLSGRSD